MQLVENCKWKVKAGGMFALRNPSAFNKRYLGLG
jgi:hypothetical protein